MSSSLTIKRGDTRPYFSVTLVDGFGEEVILNVDDTVRFSMRDSSSTVIVNRQTAAFTPGSGDVEYRWQVGDTDVAGDFDAEWEVTYADGTVQTFPAYDFDWVYIEGDIA